MDGCVPHDVWEGGSPLYCVLLSFTGTLVSTLIMVQMIMPETALVGCNDTTSGKYIPGEGINK